MTDQFLCSGMENDDNPCKGEWLPPIPQAPSLDSLGEASVHARMWVHCPDVGEQGESG